MTQPTKPSAGALRAALNIYADQFGIESAALDAGSNTHNRWAIIIDRETGMGELSELLEATKGAVVYLQRINLSLGIPVKETLQQAIAKCEGKGSE